MSLHATIPAIEAACEPAYAPTDAALLERYRENLDEGAFETLLRRHGPMVLGVCQRVLGDWHLAQDACQATFLVLVRKARSIDPPDMIGPWLYGVAYRTALAAKAIVARRAAQERKMQQLLKVQSPSARLPELDGRVDEALARLPGKYRLPVILCDLEGYSRGEAAAKLKVPEGTLSSRLARGREVLRGQLVRRGVVMGATAIVAALAPGASGDVPVALIQTTLKTASLYAAGNLAGAAAASAAASAFAKGALHAMFIAKLKIAAIAFLAIGIAGTSAGVATLYAMAAKDKAAAAVEKAAADVQGNVTAVSADGTQVTIERPGAKVKKGEPAPADQGQNATVTITPQTQVLYNRVGPDAAKPTVGYSATGWYGGNQKELARLVFTGDRSVKGPKPDVSGVVAAVSGDGKAITFERPAVGKGDKALPAQTIRIELTDKTKITYRGVGSDGAKPTEGYQAMVTLAEGSTTTAAEVIFLRQGEKGKNGAKGAPPAGADLVGAVTGVAPDKTKITVLKPFVIGKGDQLPQSEESIDIALTENSRIMYNDVGPNGATPTVGYQASVNLAGGTMHAAEITFTALPNKNLLVSGIVAQVKEDGRRLTVQLPPKDKLGGPGETVELLITNKTRVAYDSVAFGGAHLKEGYMLQARLVDGSKDTAAEVTLRPAKDSNPQAPKAKFK